MDVSKRKRGKSGKIKEGRNRRNERKMRQYELEFSGKENLGMRREVNLKKMCHNFFLLDIEMCSSSQNPSNLCLFFLSPDFKEHSE